MGRSTTRIRSRRDDRAVTRLLDDFTVGEKFTTGEIEITEAMILAFARDYDPQPFHIDPVAAKDRSMAASSPAASRLWRWASASSGIPACSPDRA
jgi:acyl dehydratase